MPRWHRLLLFLSLGALALGCLAVAGLGSSHPARVPVPAGARAAALRPITGTLDKPGYTVMAVAANGSVNSVIARSGAFSVVPPARVVTLHLRGPDGVYAGPVLLRERGDPVKAATAQVSKAETTVRQAKRLVASAQRSLKHAQGTDAKRRASTRLKQARARLKSANAQLARARRALSDVQSRVRWAPLGVRAGARLGTITLNSAGGFAVAGRLSATAWKTWVDATRTAQARAGVPIGAGRFGLVRSTLRNGASIGDIDRDGIPNSLDIDANGNMILDAYDRSAAGAKARGAAVGGEFPGGGHFHITTSLASGVSGVNVDGGSTDAQISAVQVEYGQLGLFWIGVDLGSTRLDCHGLSFCSLGGTGRIADPWPSGPRTPFPECCQPDQNGFGLLTKTPPPPGGTDPGPDFGATAIFHGATIDKIKTGDVLILHATVNGTPIEAASTLGFAFSTPAVIASYNDGQGDTATFWYPRTGCPGHASGFPCPSPVRAGPGGDVVAQLSLWRPQRTRIPGDPGTGSWIDIGRLDYMVTLTKQGQSKSVACPASSYSETDPNLTPTPSSPWGMVPTAGGLRDLAADQPASPENKLMFTLNMTQCLASQGITFAPSDRVSASLTVILTDTNGEIVTAASLVDFERQG